MISLFPITKIISILGVLYAVLLVLLFSFVQVDKTQNKILLAIRYASLFELFLVSIFLFFWRYIWKIIPILNDILFPDMNGDWDIEIHWNWKKKKGIKKGKIYIKQNFIKLSIDLITDESESETLMIQPKKHNESNLLQLYYIYRNTPKVNDKERTASIGTAILKSDPDKKYFLVGSYFTDSKTKGIFKILNRNIST